MELCIKAIQKHLASFWEFLWRLPTDIVVDVLKGVALDPPEDSPPPPTPSVDPQGEISQISTDQQNMNWNSQIVSQLNHLKILSWNGKMENNLKIYTQMRFKFHQKESFRKSNKKYSV